MAIFTSFPGTNTLAYRAQIDFNFAGSKMSGNQTLSYILENSPIKSVSLAVTTLIIVTVVPLYYAIIWYERFGNDTKRTLINQVQFNFLLAVIR
jgi:hypothetical protein